MLNPSVVIGSILSASFAAGAMFLALTPEHPPRSLDVTGYTVVGQGCGGEATRERVFVAVEEDDLPGPLCDVVTGLVTHE